MPALLFSKRSQIAQSVIFIQCLMILTISMCFRCKGWQQQFPGPVGLHQWYHRSDGTRVKGTQLSGIPALLWGTAVMWWDDLTWCCFQHMPVRLLSPRLRVGGGKKRERLLSILTLFYMRAATDVSFEFRLSVENWHLSYIYERYTLILKLLFSALIELNSHFYLFF